MATMNLTRVAPHTCVVCGAFFTPIKRLRRKYGMRFVAYTGAKTCSSACEFSRMRQFDAMRAVATRASNCGPNNHNWKGGSSCLQRGYHGPDWKNISEKARKRDGYACQRCGVKQTEQARTLHVHHIIPAANFTDISKANRLSNLITLCSSCHGIVEATAGPVQIHLFNGLSRSQRKGIRARGSRVFGARLTDNEVVRLRAEYAIGCTTRELSSKFGLSQASVCAAINGDTWKHIPVPDYSRRPKVNPGPKPRRREKNAAAFSKAGL